MAIIVGTGDFKYRIVEDWAKLPDGWSFKEVGAVGVDDRDNVYVFNRGEHPGMVFDRGGKATATPASTNTRRTANC